MGLFSTVVLPGAELSLGYASELCKTIPADVFNKMPSKDFNSPAFNIGHLATYPNNVLGMIGRGDLVKPLPFSADLFKQGASCVDQPGLYPSKDVLMSSFDEGYRRVIDAVRGCDDSVFERVNPIEGRFRELMPTVGAAVNFMLGGHLQMHLGQVSAWRRAMGLGSIH
jgi:hypothetical protein